MKQHYNPVFYLNRWCDENNQIKCYIIDNEKHIKTKPANIGFENNLFSKEKVPANQKDIIETNLYSRIDSDASNIMNIIVQNCSIKELKQNEKVIFGQFIISLLVRHPVTVNYAKTLCEKEITDLILTPETRYLYKENFEERKKNMGIEITAALATSKTSPMNKYGITNFDENIEKLLQMTWWLEDFSNTPFNLLTSDYPLNYKFINEINPRNSLLKDIFSYAGCLLSFPLSPNLCFYASRNKIDYKDKKKLIKERNFITVANARKYIYSIDNTQDYFISNNIKKNRYLSI